MDGHYMYLCKEANISLAVIPCSLLQFSCSSLTEAVPDELEL